MYDIYFINMNYYIFDLYTNSAAICLFTTSCLWYDLCHHTCIKFLYFENLFSKAYSSCSSLISKHTFSNNSYLHFQMCPFALLYALPKSCTRRRNVTAVRFAVNDDHTTIITISTSYHSLHSLNINNQFHLLLDLRTFDEEHCLVTIINGRMLDDLLSTQ